jgi:predicted XRE-type DNA-binding protein
MKNVISDKLTAKNASDLAEILGLSVNEGAEMEFRANLNIAIVKKFKESKYTQEKLAKLAKVSRTRLTALLNYNTQGLSTDFMIRVLSALGYKADIKLTKIA